jgi:hypothetical protein
LGGKNFLRRQAAFSIGPCLAIRPGRRAASIRRLLETVPEHQRDAARKPAAKAAVVAAQINIVQPKRRLSDCSCSPNPNLRNDHFRVVTIPVVAQVLSVSSKAVMLDQNWPLVHFVSSGSKAGLFWLCQGRQLLDPQTDMARIESPETRHSRYRPKAEPHPSLRAGLAGGGHKKLRTAQLSGLVDKPLLTNFNNLLNRA